MDDHVETLKQLVRDLGSLPGSAFTRPLTSEEAEAIRAVLGEIKRLRAGKCSTCKAANGDPSPVITHLQQNLAFVGGEKKQAEVRIKWLEEEIARLHAASGFGETLRGEISESSSQDPRDRKC